ncbi:MAG: serine hydrolase [Clostridia bacterium]|nr:serine hydrolase [Clostridia bacterium]
MNKEKLHNIVEEQQPNICQISAIKNNEIVYSDTWNNYNTNDNVHIASVTKSIMSLLIGIAIDKGMIKNVYQKVLDFFPYYIIKRGEKTIQNVTLYNLLTMTAPYKYKSEPWTKVCTSDDWTKSVLDLLGGRNEITSEFKYSTLGIHILSAIITRASNMTTLEFANEYLFKPLGIKERKKYIVKNKEEHISFVTSKSPKENGWFCDNNGIVTSGFGLCLSAEDLAKIGQMCLNKGEFNGKRIVSSEWITQITTPYVKCDEKFAFMQYGFLWWIIDDKKKIYSAIGDSGNVIYVNTDKNIVISVTATFKPLVFDRVEFIQKYIEPFITK